jgi:3-isopropylmalate/(R)-2-methylmalate dehydratase small subunit
MSDGVVKSGGGDPSLAPQGKLKGRAIKLGDNISTDHIAPGRLFHLRSNLPELAKHVFEDADPNFSAKLKPGDFVVAGNNFGLGSSREHAPTIIKLAGVGAVLAKSVARIFFRNAINVGLPVLMCNTDLIEEGDELEVELETGRVHNVTRNLDLTAGRIPASMLKILTEGGLAAYVRNHGDLDF